MAPATERTPSDPATRRLLATGRTPHTEPERQPGVGDDSHRSPRSLPLVCGSAPCARLAPHPSPLPTSRYPSPEDPPTIARAARAAPSCAYRLRLERASRLDDRLCTAPRSLPRRCPFLSIKHALGNRHPFSPSTTRVRGYLSPAGRAGCRRASAAAAPAAMGDTERVSCPRCDRQDECARLRLSSPRRSHACPGRQTHRAIAAPARSALPASASRNAHYLKRQSGAKCGRLNRAPCAERSDRGGSLGEAPRARRNVVKKRPTREGRHIVPFAICVVLVWDRSRPQRPRCTCV